ncbi:hypothetical protein PVT67_16595 [Gallaecimonas kandeliae]|nr:hypothetical protein [Gallaecimonas kandeliae]WKE65262.1 hypothetical protein PVT67_16595 [Gallaecimonas kandeliae]
MNQDWDTVGVTGLRHCHPRPVISANGFRCPFAQYAVWRYTVIVFANLFKDGFLVIAEAGIPGLHLDKANLARFIAVDDIRFAVSLTTAAEDSNLFLYLKREKRTFIFNPLGILGFGIPLRPHLQQPFVQISMLEKLFE